METPPPPSSPYRVGSWTITQLKEELKQRNLSPAGKKQELIDRLERYEQDAQLATPRHSRKRDRSPSKNSRARSASRKRAVSKSSSGLLGDDESTSTPKRAGRPKKNMLQQEWIHTPLRMVPSPPTQPIASNSNSKRGTPSRTSTPTRRQQQNGLTKPGLNYSRVLVAIGVALACFLLVPFLLPSRPELEPFRQAISWYINWVHLGVANTLGVSANTWASHLGPFIARVTTSAFVCKTTAFIKTDMHGVVCPKGPSPTGQVNAFTILVKVLPDVFSWGLGSAIAELVPFLLATAFIKALNISKGAWSSKILRLLQTPQKNFGPNEALLLAALPNPIMDTAGLFCGLCSLSMASFLRSMLLGKVLIRGIIQASIVVVIFSKNIVEPVLTLIKQYAPSLANTLYNEITAQRSLYQTPVQEAALAMTLRTALKFANMAVLVFFALHAIVVMIKYRRPVF